MRREGPEIEISILKTIEIQSLCGGAIIRVQNDPAG
jgi:hypothetical protein